MGLNMPFTAKKIKEGKLEEKVRPEVAEKEPETQPFSVGELVYHATFGVGMVDRLLPNQIASILFGKSRRDIPYDSLTSATGSDD